MKCLSVAELIKCLKKQPEELKNLSVCVSEYGKKDIGYKYMDSTYNVTVQEDGIYINYWRQFDYLEDKYIPLGQVIYYQSMLGELL